MRDQTIDMGVDDMGVDMGVDMGTFLHGGLVDWPCLSS